MRSTRTSRGSAVLALLVLVGAVWSTGGAAAAAGERCTAGVVCLPEESTPAPVPSSTTTTTTTAPPPPAPAAQAPAPADADPIGALLTLLNRERRERGLPILARRADVEQIAAGWSDHLADAGTLSHNDDYFSASTRQRLGGRALGENVAFNQSVEAAHASLMNSPHHRDNILDARFTVVGLGAVPRNGSWWITEDFLQPTGGAPRPAASPAPAAPAPTRPAVRVTAQSKGTGAPPATTPAPPAPASTSSFVVAPEPPQPLSIAAPGVTPGTDAEGTRATAMAVAGITVIGATCMRRRPRRRAR